MERQLFWGLSKFLKYASIPLLHLLLQKHVGVACHEKSASFGLNYMKDS